MTNANDARRAHDLLDGISNGRQPYRHEIDHLRSFLPERPKQKALEEIIAHVDDAWSVASDNDWGGNSYDPDVSIEDWLTELHVHLKGLMDTPVAEPANPAHPEFLETEADYQNAPEGTIVAAGAKMPYIKGAGLGAEHMWRSAMDGTSTSFDMSIFPMSLEKKRVLRWGWGE